MRPSHYLVNKSHPLPGSYYPTDLVRCSSIPFDASPFDIKRCICAIAEPALNLLYLSAREDGANLVGVSAFRSYARQQEIYDESIKAKGIEHTRKYIAAPGTSEHQTGLAIDVSCPELNYDLSEEFADTKEGTWLQNYAYQFDFIISYPKNNPEGYAYEPWHIRYSCKDARYYV